MFPAVCRWFLPSLGRWERSGERRAPARSSTVPRVKTQLRLEPSHWSDTSRSAEERDPARLAATPQRDSSDDRQTVASRRLVNRRRLKLPSISARSACRLCERTGIHTLLLPAAPATARPRLRFSFSCRRTGISCRSAGAPSVHPVIACICCCRVLPRRSQLPVAYGASVPLTYHRWSLRADG